MNLVSPSHLDTNNPGTWPVYYKVIVWGVLVAAILFLFNQFFNKDLDDQIAANNSKIGQAQSQYQKLYQYTLDLNQYEQRSQELLIKLEGLLAYLPLQDQMPQLIDSVYKAASDNGINFGGFTPVQEMKAEEYYNVAPISLQTTTYFENFAKFTESLTHLERIMNVSDFTLKIHKDNTSKKDGSVHFTDNALDVTAQLQTYIYNQDIEKLRKGDLSDYEDKNKTKK